MEEIEVKITDVDVKATIKKLEDLGAKKVHEANQRFVLYDYPDLRLKKEGKIFRLRENGHKIEMTLKERVSKDKSKIMIEHETNISDLETAKKIVSSIGMVETTKGEKHRISYRVKNVEFEFDTIPGIPTYLEIEAPDEKTLFEYVKKLGFKESDAKPWTSKDIVEYYNNE